MSIFFDKEELAKKTDTISGGQNLIPFAMNFKNLSHWHLLYGSSKIATLEIAKHDFYYSAQRSLLLLLAQNSSTSMLKSDNFLVKPHTTYTFSIELFGDMHVSSLDVYFLSCNSYANDDYYENINKLFDSVHPSTSQVVKYSKTFTTNNDVEGYIRIDHKGIKDNAKTAGLYICSLKLEEGTHATAPSQSPSDYYDSDTIGYKISQLQSRINQISGGGK